MKEVETTGQQTDAPSVKEGNEISGETRAQKEAFGKSLDSLSTSGEAKTETGAGLNDGDRDKLKLETGWSEEVISQIDNRKQADIYKNAGLQEKTVNGRECLVKDIDYDYVDEKTGKTNRELMAMGRSPYDAKTGERIELHHMGQKSGGSFAELRENSEHGNGNHAVLHPKTEGSWRREESMEAQYAREKREHWKARSEGDQV